MYFEHACTKQNRLSILHAGWLALFITLLISSISSRLEAATMDGGYNMILNGRSVHLSEPPPGSKFNENNFGSGLQYDFPRQYGSKWVAFTTSSAFYDSFNNISYYAGGGESRRFYLRGGWHADVGYVGFLMARKDFDNYSPFPGVLPVASIGTRNISMNITYVPPVHEGLAELLFFQLKIASLEW